MAALLHLAWLRGNFPITVQLPLLRFGQKKSDSLLLGCPVVFSAGCCFPDTFSIHFNPPSLAVFHHFPSCNALSIPKDAYTPVLHCESSICSSNGRHFYQDELRSLVNVPSISLPHFLFSRSSTVIFIAFRESKTGIRKRPF